MKSSKIAIIGSGNMGTSLLSGLIATGLAPNQIWIADPDQQKLDALHTQFNVNISNDNNAAAREADVIILAVKPQILPDVAKNLADIVKERKPLIVSIAAGIREEKIMQWFGGELAIVRCMPNTPALVRCGASALHANKYVTDPERELAESILRAVGIVVWLEDERLMDAVTALSGSGPAYFFLVIEALQNVGETMGLPTEIARILTLQTALGSARMALESEELVSELRSRVTSPGGTTEAAMLVFEEHNIRELFNKALLAAKKRSEELS